MISEAGVGRLGALVAVVLSVSAYLGLGALIRPDRRAEQPQLEGRTKIVLEGVERASRSAISDCKSCVGGNEIACDLMGEKLRWSETLIANALESLGADDPRRERVLRASWTEDSELVACFDLDQELEG